MADLGAKTVMIPEEMRTIIAAGWRRDAEELENIAGKFPKHEKQFGGVRAVAEKLRGLAEEIDWNG